MSESQPIHLGPMREKQLRDAADCCLCRKPIGNSGLPLFFRVHIERHGVNAGAIQRQTGLAMMLGGNAALAMVMGADEAMTTVLDSKSVTVCETCALERQAILWELFGGDS